MNGLLSQMARGPGTLIYSGACEWRSHPGIVDNCCKLWICPSHLLIILERAAVTIRDSCRAPSSGATTHTNDFRGCYFAEQFYRASDKVFTVVVSLQQIILADHE